jgi:hypothetical protein
MSKWSSYKKSQKLWENWRRHLVEDVAYTTEDPGLGPLDTVPPRRNESSEDPAGLEEDEQLELPGIPAGDPQDHADSLEIAKDILQGVITGTYDAEQMLSTLIYAAPRHIRTLKHPLPGLQQAATVLAMKLRPPVDRLGIDSQNAEQIINILKKSPRMKDVIDPILLRLKGAHYGLGSQTGSSTGARYDRYQWAKNASESEKAFLETTFDDIERLQGEEDLAGELADLKEHDGAAAYNKEQ